MMADKGVSSGSGPANAALTKTKKVILNKPGGNDVRKLKIKPGGRNLLPSKVTVGQTSSSNKGNNGAVKPVPVRPKPVQSSVAQPKNQTQLLDAHYGNYLQSFLESALLEDTRRLQHMSQVDNMASRCADVTIMSQQMNKIFADRNATKITVSLDYLKTIRSAFDNLVDFTGEETLMEIHSILTSKYEKLRLEGAVIDEPLFQNHELEKILNILSTQACNDETKVMGWCSEYVGKLKQLTVSSEKSIRNSELLEESTRVLLEKCSLLACDTARISECTVEQLIPEENDSLQHPTKENTEGNIAEVQIEKKNDGRT